MGTYNILEPRTTNPAMMPTCSLYVHYMFIVTIQDLLLFEKLLFATARLGTSKDRD